MRRSSRRRQDDAGAAPKRQKLAQIESEQEETTEWSSFLREKCLFQPSRDLFAVVELAHELQPETPCEAFVNTLGLRLCGPFDLLATTDKKLTLDKPLHLHGRFFFDPPEVTTVMADTESDVGQHWGYLRDAPDEAPTYVVQAANSHECKFNIVGSNLLQVLETRVKTRRSTLGKGKADELLRKIEAHRSSTSDDYGATARRKRAKDIVAESLHGLGIVVPVNAKTNTGYRELPTTGEDLEDLLRQVKSKAGSRPARQARKRLSELITRATIASDECDFGTGLLLGLDVFTAGPTLEKEALQLLRVAYMLLRRAEFYKIASGHCKFRSQDDANAPICCIVSANSDQKAASKQLKESTVDLPASICSSK